ncbi:MAG: Asp-tRNA(Asn)/Glu-tRNA(Gln) amidotransferase subunit GatB [Dehalococcoidia bacterium]
MDYEAVIGLETHVQLRTRSKMFCSCGADYQASAPNTRVCPVCLALPGTLPVVNKQAVEDAVMIGLALNCQIAEVTKFDRKNYAYPDLMKGYQISQYDVPICHDGYMELPGDPPARIGITRVHMEEDVARLVHIVGADSGPGHALMDVNRAGVPLMEVVSEPDMRSSAQAEAYISQLQAIIRYLGVGTANMEEGSFRCDANVSVRPKGSEHLTTKVEVKNMNRVRAVTRAIEHEIARQIKVYEDGGRVTQETRGWDDVRGVTVPQRSKEEAHDYRYFPEPDLPPLRVDPAWVDEIRERLPELPVERQARFQSEWGLSEYDAALLTSVRTTADYFEKVLETVDSRKAEDRSAFAKETANWLNGEMARLMNAGGARDVFDTRVSPEHLATLVERFRKRELNNSTAKMVFEEMFNTGAAPEQIIEQKGLKMVSDTSSLGPIVEDVVSQNEAAVSDYLKGKEGAVRFLVGQVMKASRGQADPQAAADLINERLESLKTAQ